MLGQREKIIVIHLKSFLEFGFEVIQGHSRSFMTRLRSNRLGIRLWWRCNQICVETYVITNGVNDTTNNQTKTDEKTTFWYPWVHWNISWLSGLTHYKWLTSICIMKTNFGNTSKENPHTYHQRNLHIFPI